mmetsp:Transcript_27574/g.43021  ORF Transcript_27574/g.43021 Transcript_27574/m.43021 type:complete len:206 (+) Transcript_27574:252-869(+)
MVIHVLAYMKITVTASFPRVARCRPIVYSAVGRNGASAQKPVLGIRKEPGISRPLQRAWVVDHVKALCVRDVLAMIRAMRHAQADLTMLIVISLIGPSGPRARNRVVVARDLLSAILYSKRKALENRVTIACKSQRLVTPSIALEHLYVIVFGEIGVLFLLALLHVEEDKCIDTAPLQKRHRMADCLVRKETRFNCGLAAFRSAI